MFDLSFTELMLVGVVALVVIGPEKLPKVARTVGHLLGRAQRYVSDVKGDIQREVELDELRKMKDEMESAAQSVKGSFAETEARIKNEFNASKEEFSSLESDMKGDDEPTKADSSSTPQSTSQSTPQSTPQSTQADTPEPAPQDGHTSNESSDEQTIRGYDSVPSSGAEVKPSSAQPPASGAEAKRE